MDNAGRRSQVAGRRSQRIGKRGDYKWGIMLSLILGLMVLSLSLYFIFHELWSETDMDRQICRQSIQLRALLPDVEKGGFTLTSFKDEYPLKCKTHVVEVDKGDVKDLDKIIGETMAECWALYGRGDENAFPGGIFKSSVCVPCARIHLTDGAREELGARNISIMDALKLPMENGGTYYDFLKNSGNKFSALDLDAGIVSSLESDSFILDNAFFGENDLLKVENKLNFATYSIARDNELFLPGVFYAEKGDLIINYGATLVSGSDDFGDYIPYLFYFQSGQDPNPFDQVKNNLFHSVNFCSSWEGIPA